MLQVKHIVKAAVTRCSARLRTGGIPTLDGDS